MKPTRLALAEHATITWHHVPEIGTSLEDVCAPSYWTHVARSLRGGQKIEVLSPMGDWWAMLLVRVAGSQEAAVSVLQHVVLGAAETVTEPDAVYEIKWRGPSAKWSIVRKEDSVVVKEHIDSQDIASQWLKNHMKAMAA